MSNIKAIILGAGMGTRMKSKLPKVLHKVSNKEMINHVIDETKRNDIDDICIVVGHKADMIIDTLGDSYVYREQKERLGTGHAVMMAKDFIDDDSEVLILCGDTPLIKSSTIRDMIDYHYNNKNTVTVLSTIIDDATGYGRIIRDKDKFMKIVEQKDANIEEQKVKEINSGMYIFNGKWLKYALDNISNNNSAGEYYLTDTIEILKDKGEKIDLYLTYDKDEILGVNNRVQLAKAEEVIKNRINEYHMLEGVTIIDPNNTYIGTDVVIGRDTIIYPGTILEGRTTIGEGCIIGPNTRIVNSNISNDVSINSSVVLDSSIGSGTTVGPFAYIRPNCNIGKNIRVGDFVELKNSNIDSGTKISHLTYIGDADVGKDINFGCGTVVVNYDGKHKYRTTIKDGAFIGCNTNLISPVVVNENAYTAAGSTITDDVPSENLAIARARQVNKEGWVKKYKEKE